MPGPALSETLDAYLDSGGAIEACARKLFVHPNTVRYRLKRIADFTGRDATTPRDAYVLRVASTVGPAESASTAFEHVEHVHRTDNETLGSRPGTRPGRVTGCRPVSMASHHMLFCGVSTKR